MALVLAEVAEEEVVERAADEHSDDNEVSSREDEVGRDPDPSP